MNAVGATLTLAEAAQLARVFPDGFELLAGPLHMRDEPDPNCGRLFVVRQSFEFIIKRRWRRGL